MTDHENDAIQTQKLFSGIRESDLTASPFLKTRVLAQVRELKGLKDVQRKLWFWRVFSLGSLATVVGLAFLNFQHVRGSQTASVTKQAYVIHVDFDEHDKEQVAQAEVTLPQGLHFVSSHHALTEQKTMKLPIEIKSLGRSKLPFVVASDASGDKEIIVRLLNQNNQLIREQVLKLKFAKQDSSITF